MGLSTLTTTSGARAADHAEAPRTLEQAPPRTLGVADQLGLWGNLGVSILGFTGAIFVLYPTAGPGLSLTAGFVALIAGTVLGTAGVTLAAIPGTQTGAPAMVLLRGLFGARLSWLPTACNIVQLLGWTTFELVTISTALHQITDVVDRRVWVLIGGLLTTALALRPLGWIRVLRRYVTALVVVALVYLAVQLLRNPLPSLTAGTWHGFFIALDTVIGAAVSFAPVAADYSRHSRTVRAAVAGSFLGYSATQIACYAIGMITLVTVAHGHAGRIFGSFMAIPLGTLAFAVLAVREVDQSFVDTYSTAVSVQNLRPRWDRRVLALVVGTVATVLALVLNIGDYESFLVLIGGIFVPLLGVFVVDWFVISRHRWDLTERAPARPLMLLPWLLGFAVYQMIYQVSYPGTFGWWSAFWQHVDDRLGLTGQSWMSASLLSFAVAALVTLAVGQLSHREPRPPTTAGSSGPGPTGGAPDRSV